MKNLTVIFTICLVSSALATFFAFSYTNKYPWPPDEIKKDLATVNMQDGYYIFIQCRPVAAFDSLGEVKKTGFVMTGSPKEMFNTLLRRAKKDFPKCDALIFSDVQMEHAMCIRFK